MNSYLLELLLFKTQTVTNTKDNGNTENRNSYTLLVERHIISLVENNTQICQVVQPPHNCA